MTIMTAIGLRLGDLLIKHNLTQNDLALRTGLSNNTINNIMTARYKSMDMSALIQICIALGVTMQDFFDDPLFELDKLEIS